MKALTLRQPWAQLIAIGAKRIETRSWSTTYRGPLAIHASKRDDWGYEESAVVARAQELGYDGRPWPLGGVVATCRLVDVHPTDPPPGQDPLDGSGAWTLVDAEWTHEWRLTPQEWAFGDFSPGRYAWLLADVEPLDPAVPAKGRQGLWEWSA